MALTPAPVIAFRLVIRKPAPGFVYSLQDKAGARLQDKRPAANRSPSSSTPSCRPAAMARAFSATLCARKASVASFMSQLASSRATSRDGDGRRAKIDFPKITASLVALAQKGGLVLEAGMDGQAADGRPACATIELSPSWAPKPR